MATLSNKIRGKVVPVATKFTQMFTANDTILNIFLFCVLFLQESILLLDERNK